MVIFHSYANVYQRVPILKMSLSSLLSAMRRRCPVSFDTETGRWQPLAAGGFWGRQLRQCLLWVMCCWMMQSVWSAMWLLMLGFCCCFCFLDLIFLGRSTWLPRFYPLQAKDLEGWLVSIGDWISFAMKWASLLLELQPTLGYTEASVQRTSCWLISVWSHIMGNPIDQPV